MAGLKPFYDEFVNKEDGMRGINMEKYELTELKSVLRKGKL